MSDRTGALQKNRLVIAVALIVAILPLILSNRFYFDLANKAMLNAIVCIGLNLMIGYAGQLSLGHAAFVALGAYATALLVDNLNIDPVAAITLSAGAAFAMAYLIGKPILRLKGNFLAMATLGFGIILYTVFDREVELTGGPDGRAVSAFRILGIEITQPEQWYWIIGAVLVLGIVTANALIDSPFGRGLRGMHGAENAANAAGVDVARVKLHIFCISAVYASIAGSLFAFADRFITPGEGTFLRAVELVTMVVFGGMASTAGAIFGAVSLTSLGQLSAGFSEYKNIIIGSILMLTMTLMPAGVVPTVLRTLKSRRHPE